MVQQQIFELIIGLKQDLLNLLILHQLVNFARGVRPRLFVKLIVQLRILRGASLVSTCPVDVPAMVAP